MPIKPPRLDDRSYDDIVREARALIPQYCPEWTHLGDSDPGMTLVQLFAWMTEMTLYRLNRVPDKTYVHFLNFIGEERRPAMPATVPITFSLRSDDGRVVELPPSARCATRQRQGGEALHYLTDAPVSVHGARVDRMITVSAGEKPTAREIPFTVSDDHPQALVLGRGEGVQLFRHDPIADGPWSYTPDQYVYLRHVDFLAMADDEEERAPLGTVRIRSAGDIGLPVAALFQWSYPTAAGWVPARVSPTTEEVGGLPEALLEAALPGLGELAQLGNERQPMPLPDDLPRNGWIRGQVRFERWLARLMENELRVTWRDDRGAEEREITSWYARDVGRVIEFQVHNLPPIRGGWTLRLTMVDHGLPSGREGYFPRYRWSYRRGERWVEIRTDRVELVGAAWVITGPLVDMAVDGANLRAERVEEIYIEGVLPELRASLMWRRPIEVFLASGPDDAASALVAASSLPFEPFQTMPSLPALLGMKFYFGADLLANRTKAPVLLELDVGFERDGELCAEPVDDYHLQLTYRTASGWQVVHHETLSLTRFTFATIDPDGAKRPERRALRLLIDPRTQLEGLVRWTTAGQETCWLRLELTRAALTWQPDRKVPPVPVSLRVYGVRMSLDNAPGALRYDEPMPGARLITVAHRTHNPVFSRMAWRQDGGLVTSEPFDRFVDVRDDVDAGHNALYMRFDRPLPAARRLAMMFQCRGEAFLPRGFSVQWELLQAAGVGGSKWTRLASRRDGEGDGYALDRTGVLEFPLDEAMVPSAEGVWVRGIFRRDGGPMPLLPPVTHVLLNTVMAQNLHGFRMEKYSGEGVPHQELQLRHFPVFLPDASNEARDRAADLKVTVEEPDGERRVWRVAAGNSLSNADKDDRVFVVDTVEGVLTFGNGIRGRILPVGSYNIIVESYHTVPGTAGNVAAGEVCVAEGFGDVVTVHNHLPAHGGRSAESIDEIVRRAPSILTSRDRAVTRQDFEVIAEEASAEVARAACVGTVGADGGVELVVLPRRREGEQIPDPFLAAGLKEHVASYLARRCLINVRPVVRLARFQHVDVSVDLRLRPNANLIAVREAVEGWIRRFLDPYAGGLDATGWPFGATLYAQDFARLVTDIVEVRHVVDVRVFPVSDEVLDAAPGWETAQGQQVLPLHQVDLLHVREVRVRWAKERS
jgi:hypothetical protein